MRHLILCWTVLIALIMANTTPSQAQSDDKIATFEHIEYFNISPNQEYIALYREDKAIDILNLKTLHLISTITPTLTTKNIAADWSANSQFLFVQYIALEYTGIVHVWSMADETFVAEFQHEIQQPVMDIEQDIAIMSILSTNNDWLATVNVYDRVVLLWDFAQQETIFELDNLSLEDHIFSGAEFSPDGRWLAVLTLGDTLSLWDMQTGELALETRGNTFTFSPDGSLLATGYGRLTSDIELWDLPAQQIVHTFHVPLMVGQLEFSADNSMLLANIDDGVLVNEGWVYQNQAIRGWELTHYTPTYYFPTIDTVSLELADNEVLIYVTLNGFYPIQHSLIWNTLTDEFYYESVVDTPIFLDLDAPHFNHYWLAEDILIIGNSNGEIYVTDLTGTVIG